MLTKWHILTCLAITLIAPVQGELSDYPFLLHKASLLDILNNMIDQKKAVLLVPQGADLDALKAQRVSYTPIQGNKVPFSQAWNLMKSFLELSGFSLVQRNSFTYAVVRNSAMEGEAANRDILPLYVDPKPDDLPSNDARIRAFIPFRNFKVPSLQEKEQSSLGKLLKELVSKTGMVVFEPRTNGALITDRASQVASLLRILKELDSRTITEEVAYIPLHYIRASDAEKIFDTIKKALPEPEKPGESHYIGANPVADSAAAFTRDMTVIADNQRNALIVMGRSADIDHLTDFITESLDVPQEKGESILHSYDLQYLDAKTFAPELQRIVSSLVAGEQSSQAPIRRGQEHFFKGVQITAEGIVEEKIPESDWPQYDQKGYTEQKGLEGSTFRGGNRLIIAARQDDWKIIESFIKKIDIPQLQVILEIMIADFTYDNTSKAASAIRSKTDSVILPEGVQYLSTHLATPNPLLGPTPVQLAQDLLQAIGPGGPTSLIDQGSLLISLNDPTTPGIFGLIQILQRVINTRISSYPYISVANNQKGLIEHETIKRTTADLVTTQHGTYTIPIVDVPASLKVVVTPHIVSEDRVRLDIGFTVEAFEGTTFNRLTRGLKTTATLASGQIIAMGGLFRENSIESGSEAPFLGKIPILGFFFRGNSLNTVRTNVTLFVSPTIINPRNRKPFTEKTAQKICEVREDDQPFYNNRDPLVHLLFTNDPNRTFNSFFQETTNLSSMRDDSCFTDRKAQSSPAIAIAREPVCTRAPIITPRTNEQLFVAQAFPRMTSLKQSTMPARSCLSTETPRWAKSTNSVDQLKELLADCNEPFLVC